MQAYKSIANTISYEIEPIKKSRFIAHASSVHSEQEAFEYLDMVKQLLPDARHHCWAYSLYENNKLRFSDDGEPGGSAGKPILSHITGQDIRDVIIIVTRYFGGTKLGIGGLVRAYSQAAKEILEKATITQIIPMDRLTIHHQYADTTTINGLLQRYCVDVLNQKYTDKIIIDIQIASRDTENFIAELNNLTKGQATVLIHK